MSNKRKHNDDGDVAKKRARREGKELSFVSYLSRKQPARNQDRIPVIMHENNIGLTVTDDYLIDARGDKLAAISELFVIISDTDQLDPDRVMRYLDENDIHPGEFIYVYVDRIHHILDRSVYDVRIYNVDYENITKTPEFNLIDLRKK